MMKLTRALFPKDTNSSYSSISRETNNPLQKWAEDQALYLFALLVAGEYNLFIYLISYFGSIILLLNIFSKINYLGNFPGGPGVKNHLPVQWTWVPSLVWEDPTCHRATKPTFTTTTGAQASQRLHSAPREQPPLATTREKPVHSNEDPAEPKNK